MLASGGMSVSLLVSRNELPDLAIARPDPSLSASTAGLILEPPRGDEVTLWILRIFDGEPWEEHAKCLHEYYRQVDPSQSTTECLVEGERTLRTYYGLGGWVTDSPTRDGFERSWSRRAC